MKRLLFTTLLLAILPAYGQRGGNTRPLANYADACVTGVADEASCAGYERTWCVNYTTDIIYACSPTDYAWHAVGSGAGGADFDTILAGTLQAGSYLVGAGASLSFTSTGTITATDISCTNCTTLGTETAGSYAAGDAEAGNATGLACTTCVSLLTEVAVFTSSDFATTVTGETGSGAVVFGTAPTITTPTISGFTASRCARFNASGILVPSTTGDCDSGDTGGGGGDPILIDGVAVTDGSGVDFQGGVGIDFTFTAAATPDTASLAVDNTEINDTTFGDGTDASVTHTTNVSTGTDPVWTYTASAVASNVPLTVSDWVIEPGNAVSILDNDTLFANDPTCALSGVEGQLTILDSDELETDVWDVCVGTSLKWRFPTASTTTTQALFATATSGAGAYRALAATDLPATGTWTFTGAIDAGGGSVEVGNGTGPTVDAAGEVGVDTTASQLVYYDGSAVKVLDPRETISQVVFAPTSTDDPIIFKAPWGMTITDIHCIVGAATSAVIDVQECAATGGSCSTVDTTITCDTDGAEDDGSLSNGSIDAADWVKIDIGTVTGTVGFLSVTVYYTIVRE